MRLKFAKRSLFLWMVMLGCSTALASGPNFNDTDNVAVTSGVSPNFSANVGIGSAAPNGALDVGGGSICLGHVCNSSWGGGSNYWTLSSSGNIGISTIQNVGIGTSFVGGAGEGAFVVMNGNVGIGTWVPGALFQVGNGGGASAAFTIDNGGNVGLAGNITSSGSGAFQTVRAANFYGGSSSGSNLVLQASVSNPQSGFVEVGLSGSNVGIATTLANGGTAIMNGNVGIGTWITANALDVFLPTGTVTGRLQTLGAGNAVLRLTQSGLNWDMVNNNISDALNFNEGATTYMTIGNGGNVGIGTTTTSFAALSVINGNVGIGTWVPIYPFQIGNNAFTVDSVGNIATNGGITSGSVINITGAYLAANGGNNIPLGLWSNNSTTAINILNNGGTSILDTISQSGNLGIGTLTANNSLIVASGFVGIGTLAPGGALDVGGGSICLGHVCNSSWGAGSNYWAKDSGNVGINTIYNVGLGTISQKNVLNILGNIGVGTISYSNYLKTAAPNGGAIFEGNVGIGTFAPTAALNVNGAVSTYVTSATANYAALNRASNAPRADILVGNSASDTTTGLFVAPSFSSNATQINTYIVAMSDQTPTDGNEQGTYIEAYGTLPNSARAGLVGTSSSDEQTATNSGLPLAFSTKNNENPAMTIDNGASQNIGIGTFTPMGGLTVMNGNVGIGTWVPQQEMEIRNAAGPVLRMSTSTNATYPTLSLNGQPGSAPMLFGDIAFGFDSNSATYVNIKGWRSSVNGSDLSFETANSASGTVAEKMRINSEGNVGIGTTTPVGGLTVMNGNVGIGTWVPKGTLDVGASGTICLGGVCNSSWGGGTNYWTLSSSGNIGISTIQNVGIGTSFVGGAGEAAFAVMNGNVGIGTWVPNALFQVAGNVNVGIGSVNPGTALDVNGVVRMTGFSMPAGAVNTYVLTSDGSGNGTWAAPTGSGTNYWTLQTSGNIGISTIQNVGIGTTFVGGAGEGAFVVMNGNVGIGTWLPGGALNIMNGNVGIGTAKVNSLVSIAGNNSVTPVVMQNHGDGGTGSVGVLQWNNENGNEVGLLSSGTGSNGDAFGEFALIGNLNNSAYIGEWDVLDRSIVSSDKRVALLQANYAYQGFAGYVLDFVVKGASLVTPLNIVGLANGVAIGQANTGRLTPPTNGLFVTGNVGIGTNVPKGSLDVGATGTICLGGVCNSTWPGGSGSNYWTLQTSGNIGISTIQNVGIGTSFVGGAGEASFAVMNGNVGIGTWVPSQPLQVKGNLAFQNGNIINDSSDNYVQFLSAGSSATGIRAGGLVVSSTYTGVTPPSNGGYFQGNVGIGTTTPQTAGLVVTNGNVGIGTWVADSGGLIVSSAAGNVGVGTIRPGTALDVNGAIRATGAGNSILNNGGGNVGVGTLLPDGLLSVGGGCQGHKNAGVCFATNNGALGYCTAGTWPNCTTCNAC